MNHFIQFLTYFRIIAGPIIFILILIPQSYGVALALLVLASVSDYWDGFLARKYALTSVLGAVLDPIADKILITFVVIALSLNLESIYIGFLGSLMLAREYWVSALRDFNAREGNAGATKVTYLGKTKTFVQLVTLILFLLGLFLGSALILFVADFFLFLALIITMQTGLSYTIATFKQ